MITHSSGDFIVTSIRNHHLYTLQICMICVAVISMLSSIVAQKPLITHLRMCYVCVMHENITQKNSFEMKFYSTLLLAEGIKMKEKRDTCPGSLSRCFVSEIYANPEQHPFFLPVAQYFYSHHVQDWCSSDFSTIQSFHYSHRFPRFI